MSTPGFCTVRDDLEVLYHHHSNVISRSLSEKALLCQRTRYQAGPACPFDKRPYHDPPSSGFSDPHAAVYHTEHSSVQRGREPPKCRILCVSIFQYISIRSCAANHLQFLQLWCFQCITSFRMVNLLGGQCICYSSFYVRCTISDLTQFSRIFLLFLSKFVKEKEGWKKHYSFPFFKDRILLSAVSISFLIHKLI